MLSQEEINNYKKLLGDYLIKKHGILNLKRNFNCLNPEHEDLHPSMSYSKKYKICKCFGCGVRYDLFDLIGIDYNTKNFQEQIKIAKELYPNVDIKNDNLFSNYPVKIIDYSKYFENCREDISETDYLHNRKIDLALIDKYQIGYDKKDEIVVFPINKNCFVF